MKHTINSLQHDLKSAFVDRVHGLVDLDLVERYLEEYCCEGEHQDGVRYWDNFDNVKDIIEDFKRYVEFAQECELWEPFEL